jgi:hypothetical protein
MLRMCPLEPGGKEHKWHAPGIGLVQDGSPGLANYGKASEAGDKSVSDLGT